MFLKVFFYIVVFSILHFSYDYTGCSILKPFGAINESIFQHLKIAFWSYIIASVIEYPIIKKRFKGFKSFIIPRLFSAIIVPWIIFLIWYLAPAIYGKFHIEALEVIWAIAVSILSGIIGVIFEREIQEIKFSKVFTTIIIILLLISIFLYIRFTYKLPWVDMFVDPLNL